MERTNKVHIVGTLKELPADKQREGQKDGVKWIAGTAIVESGSNEYELKFFSQEKTKKGKENKRYNNYLNLPKMIGERVRVNGELTGRVFYNEGQGQIIPFNEITAGFFNSAKPDEDDDGTFEYAGFVTKPLHERLDQDGNLINYEIEVGQANYQKDNMQIVKFVVEKEDDRIRSAVESAYTKGTTVYIMGKISYETTIEEKTEEVAFGDPIVKKFKNTRKNFFIKGGKQPITDEGLAYSASDIEELSKAYLDYVDRVEKEAKEKATATKKEPAKTSNANKLL